MSSEEEVFLGCIKGKRKAQEMLYRKYAGQVMTTCMRYAQTREEAEDMLQEVFLIVFKKINQVQNVASLSGWIRRVAVTKAIDIYHRQKKHYYHQSDTELLEESVYDNVLDSLSAQELLDLVRKLPDGYRMVFNLYVIEGYKHEEIAEMLKITANTSRSQLTKAKQALRQLLATNYSIYAYTNDSKI